MTDESKPLSEAEVEIYERWAVSRKPGQVNNLTLDLLAKIRERGREIAELKAELAGFNCKG